jgi:hypothetical protein
MNTQFVQRVAPMEFHGAGAYAERIGDRLIGQRDMPVERNRATALDRSHHLQLVGADMPAIGLTPSRAVIAEDVRDLQS